MVIAILAISGEKIREGCLRNRGKPNKTLWGVLFGIILMAVAWVSPAAAQAQTKTNNQALADCVEAANQKYKDTCPVR